MTPDLGRGAHRSALQAHRADLREDRTLTHRAPAARRSVPQIRDTLSSALQDPAHREDPPVLLHPDSREM